MTMAAPTPDSPSGPPPADEVRSGAILDRGRRSIVLDLKRDADVHVACRLLDSADVAIDPYRPGVAERLGLGPDRALERNPRLVFARMTGWGQTGPLAPAAGHDINYIAVGGALGALGEEGAVPPVPLNLVGDYGGGGMLMAFGVVAALLERERSGRGQVVDVAMVDGAALLTTMIQGLRQAGMWSEVPGTNLLDSGAPFYDVYETADGRHVAVGALEPQFHARLLALLEIPADEMVQWDREHWPEHRARLAAAFRTGTREQWAERFAGEDACVTPVLGLHEAAADPHAQARHAFVTASGGSRVRPAPAPRFARTPAEIPIEPPAAEAVLRRWGVTTGEHDSD